MKTKYRAAILFLRKLLSYKKQTTDPKINMPSAMISGSCLKVPDLEPYQNTTRMNRAAIEDLILALIKQAMN
jgi:hypothetical protein